MKIYKKAESSYFYRGAPTIQKIPSSGGQIGIYVTTNPLYASSYGEVINVYSGNGLKILDAQDGRNRSVLSMIEEFLEAHPNGNVGVIKNDPYGMNGNSNLSSNGTHPSDYVASLFLYPTAKWKDWVIASGYNATSNNLREPNTNICVFSESNLSFVGIYDVKTKSVKPTK